MGWDFFREGKNRKTKKTPFKSAKGWMWGASGFHFVLKPRFFSSPFFFFTLSCVDARPPSVHERVSSFFIMIIIIILGFFYSSFSCGSVRLAGRMISPVESLRVVVNLIFSMTLSTQRLLFSLLLQQPKGKKKKKNKTLLWLLLLLLLVFIDEK